MTRRGRGAGKLIILGEHAAVYGSPAAGTQLPCENRLSWSDGPAEFSAANSEAKPAAAFPDDNIEGRGVMRELFEAAAIWGVDSPRGGVWRHVSTIPRCGGFGSSSAICTALARILLNRGGEGYSRDVHRLANHLEERFHGTPSGIDTGLSSHSGTTAWIPVKGDVPEPRVLNFPRLHLIYGALPRREGTSSSVARLRRERDASGRQGALRIFDEIADICTNFIALAEGGGTDAAADTDSDNFHYRTAYLINRAQELLASLELSVPELEWILHAAHRLGISAGKLSGAGLGGAFFLCAADRDLRDGVLTELTLELNSKGIKLSEALRPLDIGGGTD